MSYESALQCDSCNLKGCSKVVGQGPDKAKLLFVGEAPGTLEVQMGQHFVGTAGKFLDATLAKLNASRAGCYFTNSVLCRPPEGNGANATRQPTGAEKACCRTRLLAEIDDHLHNDGVVVALGNSALSTLLQQPEIKASKMPREVSLQLPTRTVPLVGCMHPSSVLRVPSNFKPFFEKFTFAVRKAQGILGPDVSEPASDWKVTICKTPKQCLDGVNKICDYWFRTRKAYVVADIETSDFDPMTSKILCLGVANDKECFIFPGEHIYKDKYSAFLKLFSLKTLHWVWHNGKFDTNFLHKAGLPAQVDDDTMLMHYVLDETPPHGLKELATSLFGAEDYEQYIFQHLAKKSDSFSNVPRPVLYKYLSYDCWFTLQLYHALRNKIRQVPSLDSLYTKILLPAQKFFQVVEKNGMMLDLEYMDKLAIELQADIKQQLMVLAEVAAPLWSIEIIVMILVQNQLHLFLNLQVLNRLVGCYSHVLA